MAEYIKREDAIRVVEKYFTDFLQLEPDICLDGIRSLPNSDVTDVFCAGRRFYISNADHLRELPDEELAEEIMNWFAALYTVELSTKTVLEYLREPYEVKHE